jgi:hypothetical protein
MRVFQAVPQLFSAATEAHIAQLVGMGVAQAQLGSPEQPLVPTSVLSGQGDECINVTSPSSSVVA